MGHFSGKCARVYLLTLNRKNWGCASSRAFREVACRTAEGRKSRSKAADRSVRSTRPEAGSSSYVLPTHLLLPDLSRPESRSGNCSSRRRTVEIVPSGAEARSRRNTYRSAEALRHPKAKARSSFAANCRAAPLHDNGKTPNGRRTWNPTLTSKGTTLGWAPAPLFFITNHP